MSGYSSGVGECVSIRLAVRVVVSAVPIALVAHSVHDRSSGSALVPKLMTWYRVALLCAAIGSAFMELAVGFQNVVFHSLVSITVLPAVYLAWFVLLEHVARKLYAVALADYPRWFDVFVRTMRVLAPLTLAASYVALAATKTQGAAMVGHASAVFYSCLMCPVVAYAYFRAAGLLHKLLKKADVGSTGTGTPDESQSSVHYAPGQIGAFKKQRLKAVVIGVVMLVIWIGNVGSTIPMILRMTPSAPFEVKVCTGSAFDSVPILVLVLSWFGVVRNRKTGSKSPTTGGTRTNTLTRGNTSTASTGGGTRQSSVTEV